jgi:hypothetical protein
MGLTLTSQHNSRGEDSFARKVILDTDFQDSWYKNASGKTNFSIVNRDNFDFVAELYMKLPQYTLKSTRE